MTNYIEGKMTYTEAISLFLENCGESVPQEAVAKLTALKEQIAKRNASKSDKPTKAQTENIGVKGTILTTLEFLDKAVTITELQSANEELGGLSNQKVSALVRQLVEEGKVVKTTDKRKSYFAIAPAVA